MKSAGAERDVMIFSGLFLTFIIVACLIPISSACNCFILSQEIPVLITVSEEERGEKINSGKVQVVFLRLRNQGGNE